MARLLRAVGYVWAFPASVVGIIITFFLVFTGAATRMCWHDYALFYKFTPKAPNWLAIRYYSHPFVIGNIVIISTKKRDDTFRSAMMIHALAHVRQWMTFGVLLPLIDVFIMIILRLLTNADNTYDNPLEIDARRSAKQTVDIPRLKNSVRALIRGSQPK